MSQPPLQFSSRSPRELLVAVERVVRPIVCEEIRKTRMRRELLAHLTEAFESELARGADRDAALASASARLGEQAGLTAELQSAVPLADRWAALVDWCVRRGRETPRWRHAAWLAALAGGLIGGMLMLVGLLAQNELAPNRVAFRPDAVRAMLFLSAVFAATAGASGYFAGLVRDTLKRDERRLGPRAVAWATLGAVLIWGEGLLLWLIVGAPSVMWSPVYGTCWSILSALTGVSMVLLPWFDLRERRDIDPWLELEIE